MEGSSHIVFVLFFLYRLLWTLQHLQRSTSFFYLSLIYYFVRLRLRQYLDNSLKRNLGNTYFGCIFCNTGSEFTHAFANQSSDMVNYNEDKCQDLGCWGHKIARLSPINGTTIEITPKYLGCLVSSAFSYYSSDASSRKSLLDHCIAQFSLYQKLRI